MEDEVITCNIWEYKARNALNQQLTQACKKAMLNENTKNIINCLDKGLGPPWILKEVKIFKEESINKNGSQNKHLF